MLRRIVPALLLTLLVVTAGCAGGGSGDSGPATAAESGDSGPATAAESGDDGSAGDRSAGEGEPGDATALVENRTAALKATGSYASAWRMRVLEDGRVVSETRYATAMNYDTQRYSFEMEQTRDGETETSVAVYYADGRGYQRFGEGDEATYSASEAEFGTASRSGWASFGPAVSDLEDLSDEGTETYDGVRVRRYVLNRPASWIATGGQTGSSGIRWREFSYEVLVDEQGLVRAEHWSGTGTDETGTEQSIEFSYELTGVGNTGVSEPAWLSQVDE